MAAGLGFKTFTTGEVLTAADVNGYLMQGVLVFASEAARDAAITSPQEGQFAYTKDNNSLWYYTGSAWAASGATGDIEGVTAGTGISGGGTSGTVTITNSMATAIDAKGDLVAGTGADTFARLAVGANDTVLTAASGEATGLKWATVAAGGSLDFVLLNSGGTSLSGSTTSISFSAQKALFIQILGGSSTAGVPHYIKFNSSSTNLTGSAEFRIINTTTSSSFNNSEGQLMIGRINTGGATFSTNALVFGTDKTGFKPIVYMGHPSATGTDSTAVLGLGVFRNTEAITSLQVMSDGTFDAGTVYIYGAA